MKSRKNLSYLFLSSLFLLTSCAPKSEHVFTLVDKVDSTCSKTGVEAHYSCSHCDKLFSYIDKKEVKSKDLVIEINPNNHVYDKEVTKEDYITSKVSCLEDATYYKSCECGESSKDKGALEATFSAKGLHTLTHHDIEILNENYDNDEYYSCDSCNKIFDKTGENELAKVPTIEKKIRLLTKYNGRAIDNLDPLVKEFYELYDDPSTTNDEVANFLAVRGNISGTKSVNNFVDINFECDKSVKLPIYLQVASDENFSNIEQSFEINSRTLFQYRINNPYPGTHYYRFIDSATPFVSSPVDSFVISNKLRTIFTKGTVQNMRDFGGQNSTLGDIKYGLLYRSANWASISTSSEKLFSEELGLKSELDVRFSSSTDYSKSQHPINGIAFKQCGLTDYYPQMLTNSTTINNLKYLFSDYLINENNYPLAFHCTSGADRTGLLAMLIEGALGVNDEDIYKDYELTSFYISRRIRCDIIATNIGDDIYEYSFDPKAKCDSVPTPSYGSFQENINTLISTYNGGTGSISDAIVNFLIQKCGVTNENINALRSILLEAKNEK